VPTAQTLGPVGEDGDAAVVEHRDASQQRSLPT